MSELEGRLDRQEAQIAALTRRIFALEKAAGLMPFERPLNEQQAVETEVEIAAPPPVESDWEAKVGTNWLNRAGVLILVIGIVLFLGYAMTYLGAAGKIAIGVAAAIVLLGAGYWYERKDAFRGFGLGLIAGGFAVLYVTAYAAHAVDEARIVSNIYVGVAIQCLVALAAVWQAARLGSERASMLAYMAAYAGLLSSDVDKLISIGTLPLTVSGLWLADRKAWRDLPWTILLYAWSSQLAYTAHETWGDPVAWANLGLFAAFEIRDRVRLPSLRNPLFVLGNAFGFFVQIPGLFDSMAKSTRVLGLLCVAGACTSAIRWRLGVRNEAASEALTILGAAIWAASRYGESDVLLASMLVLGASMLGLWWNRQAPATALAFIAELLLALVSAALLFIYPDSKLISGDPLRIHLALPQMLMLTACLFVAGRWLSAWPWPSAMALVNVAVITLITIPKTLGTIVLAFEAILVLAAGLYLVRRPIRIGGLALFVFSILKVFLYDLNELETLARIFSFIVLGLLLIGASWAYTKYREQLRKYL